MNYVEFLRESTQRTGSIACAGMDPVIDRIPLKGGTEEVITKFYTDILQALISEDQVPGALKPNIAFYEQYGFEGLRALKKVMGECKKLKVPVILDAKRGDIDRTSAAYAKNCYEFWGADSVTIAPYMGSDSVGPFIEYCNKGKGQYILCRTSNKGAVDMQDLEVDGRPLYEVTAGKILEWGKLGTGAVVGATYPKELQTIAEIFSGKHIPLLIPGIGKQGGGVSEVLQALRDAGYDLSLCRVNSSSGINYAYEKQGTDDYAGAAVRALKEMEKDLDQ